MLNAIIAFSIKNKLLVCIGTFGLIAYGVYSVRELPIDAVPDITNNQVQILTVSPSNGAEDIERLVTIPIEQVMRTIPKIIEMRSFCRFGLSVITIVFKENVDIYWARQQVNERLVTATNQIPSGMGTPELAPLTTGLGEIYQYILNTKKGYENKYSIMELRSIQEWVVRKRLLGVEGVADVSSFGGLVKQYEITLNTDKLRSMNISIGEVFTALSKNNQNTGGAYIDKNPRTYFIKSEGLVKQLSDIEEIVVKTDAQNIPILIRDIGKVQFGNATRYGAMTKDNHGEIVGAVVMMLKGANANRTIKNVKTQIATIQQSLPEGITIESFLDRTRLVNNTIKTVTTNLVEGALIVLFVLVVLLGNLRAGLLVASVIPLAMLFAIVMMNLFSVSGNLMSLGALDFGLIVDGTVIIVEATLHYIIRTKQHRVTQAYIDESVQHAATTMLSSAVFGELIILVVYLPILSLVGIEGKMFKPMAQTVSFAIVGAFLLSLTYVPMMTTLVLSKKVSHKKNISDSIMQFFHRIYRPAIAFALRIKKTVLLATVGLLACSILLFIFLGAEFIPTLDEGDFAVETRLLAGSSLPKTIAAVQRSSDILKNHFTEVESVVGKIGSSEIPTDPMPFEAADMIVKLKDKNNWVNAHSREALAEKMLATLESQTTGVTFSFQQPIQMRFNELMTGAKQDVIIKIYGDDLDLLAGYAKSIGTLVQQTKNAKDVYVEKVTGLEQIIIQFHRDKIARYGLAIQDINTTIRTAFAGASAGSVFEGERKFDLVVRLEKNNRKNINDIQNLIITTPNGNQIPLVQVADIVLKECPNQIQRENTKRRIIVGFNVRGRDVESIVDELQQKINKKIKFAPGYYVSYGGTFENLQTAKQRLSIALPIALLLIFLLLYLAFRSIQHSAIIFATIPLSAMGGVFTLWARGMPFSISAGVGFIALFGVAVLNGIVLIASFNQLKKQGMTDLHEIVLLGTRTRLRPILMTALVASLGFLPMALTTGSSAEVQKPLATVVIGGLMTATLLTLFVLPILYTLVEKVKIKKLVATAVVLLLIGTSCISTTQAQTPTSLRDAIDRSIANNKQIIAATDEVAYQRELNKFPTDISKTNILWEHGQYNSIAPNDDRFLFTQNLPLPTVFIANKALGTAIVQSSQLKLAATKSELVYQVKLVYNKLQYLHAVGKLLILQDTVYRDFLKIATLQYATGDVSMLPKILAETQLNEIQNIRTKNETDTKIYYMQLQSLLHTHDAIVISDTTFVAHNIAYAMDSVSIEYNPTLAYIKQEITIHQKKQKVAVSTMLPDVSIAYFNQSMVGPQSVNGQDIIFDKSKRFQGFQLGVNVPIFNSYFYKTHIKAADIQKRIAVDNYELMRTTVETQLQQALQEYFKNKNTITYYEQSAMPNAELILKQVKTAYAKGEIAYNEFLLGVKSAITIKENYITALYQYNQSVMTIAYLLNKQ